MLKQRLHALLPDPLRPALRGAVVRARFRGLQADDALLVSYPKSGSTWLRFLVVHAITGEETDFDAVRTTFPPLGRQRVAPPLLAGGGRLVRTHEPMDTYRGPAETQIVYLARDARDVALSYARHIARIGGTVDDIAVFVDDFLAGAVDSYGAWQRHVTSALAYGAAHPDRFLALRFEDLRADPKAVLGQVLAFLGTPAVVDLDDVVAANTSERMRAKEDASEFLRAENADGSAFVTTGERLTWEAALPADRRQRFDAVTGGARQALEDASGASGAP